MSNLWRLIPLFRLFLGICSIVWMVVLAPSSLSQSMWINPGVGDWFAAGNWSFSDVPVASTYAIIANGGEAQALFTGASVTASHLEVGTTTALGSCRSTAAR